MDDFATLNIGQVLRFTPPPPPPPNQCLFLFNSYALMFYINSLHSKNGPTCSSSIYCRLA